MKMGFNSEAERITAESYKELHDDEEFAPPDTSGIPRREIFQFAHAMEAEMARHDAEKGDSWKECAIDVIQGLLSDNFEDWADAIEGSMISNAKLIDIANLAMMLWWRQ